MVLTVVGNYSGADSGRTVPGPASILAAASIKADLEAAVRVGRAAPSCCSCCSSERTSVSKSKTLKVLPPRSTRLPLMNTLRGEYDEWAEEGGGGVQEQ